jgi:CheY-like chemotaxis protein
LLVDDEAPLRGFIRIVLRGQGYVVLEAADGAEALRLGEQHPGPIDLLLTDVEMPGLGGRQVAEHLAPLRPGLRVLYLSGHARADAVEAGKVPEGAALLEKPFRPDGLLDAVRRLLAAGSPPVEHGPSG